MLLKSNILALLYLVSLELLLINNSWSTSATLSKSKKGKDTCKSNDCKPQDLVGPIQTTVFNNNLVSKTIKYQDILKYNKAYFDDVYERRFTGEVLGYVTPWNSHGYDIAKTFPKFTLISPVWLQIIQPQRGVFKMQGTHDIDDKWIRDVRKKNHMAKIVPRLLLDGWNLEGFLALFNNDQYIYRFVETITNFVEERQLDGIVLELWSQLGGQYKMEVSQIIKELGEAMMSRKQKLILVIPPPMANRESPGMFSKEDFDLLAPIVDGFSLMTYDYPHFGKPGPVAPYDWVKQCVESLVPEKNLFRQKIFVGLNFYGYNYKGHSQTPIIGNTYLEVLKKYNPNIKWQKDNREHRIEFKESKNGGRTTIYYPSLQSIEERIELARELGTGLAIWEIGQGLDFFYDLL